LIEAVGQDGLDETGSRNTPAADSCDGCGFRFDLSAARRDVGGGFAEAFKRFYAAFQPPLGEDFDRQWFEPEVIAGVEQDRTIRNGHDLR
jgi:hypothetical protein